MKREINVENVEHLFEKKSSKEVLFHALNLLKPSKETYKKDIAFLIICLLPAILVSTSVDTIKFSKESIEIISGVVLALFAVVFTGYAFFQALINKDLLIWMLQDDNKSSKDNEQEDKKQKDKKDKDKSRLQITNEYFAEIMMLQGLSIFISLFLRIVLVAVPEQWSLLSIQSINIIIALLLLLVYFYFNFLVIWEIKSFIFNIFQLFNAHAGAKVLSMFRNEDDNRNNGV